MSPTFPVLMFGKRFALIGLDDQEEAAVSEALTQVRAKAHRVSGEGALAGVNALAPYDACIVDIAAIAGDKTTGGITLADLECRHVLAIADESQLVTSELASMHPQWEVIVRPLRSPELVVRLSRLMVRSGQKTLPHLNDNIRRVLVVDDDPTVRVLMSVILETSGFKCDCVPSASEALAALALGRHALVMLDLGMPEMDGFKVLKAIRGAHPARSPAVIIVTAATREEDVLRGFGLGADDYVTKPFNPRELVARCQRAIRNHDSSGPGLRESAARSRSIEATH